MIACSIKILFDFVVPLVHLIVPASCFLFTVTYLPWIYIGFSMWRAGSVRSAR